VRVYMRVRASGARIRRPWTEARPKTPLRPWSRCWPGSSCAH